MGRSKAGTDRINALTKACQVLKFIGYSKTETNGMEAWVNACEVD